MPPDFFKSGTERSDVNTAPFPGLSAGLEQFLQQFLQNPNEGGGLTQQNPLLQQAMQGFQQILNDPGIITRQANSAAQSILQPAGRQVTINRQIAQGRSSNASPARFSKAQKVAEGDIALRAQADFDAFSSQVLQNSRQQALAEILGPLSGAAGFSSGINQQNNALLSQLLNTTANLGAGPAVISQNQSGFSSALDIGGLIAQFAAGGGGSG